MKLKKKSGLMGAVIALSAASLVSVGFASWVISQSDSATVSGTISVETVTNKSHMITDVQALSGSTISGADQVYTFGEAISFGAPSGVANDGWLTNVNGTPEHLSAGFSFVVTNVKTAPAANVLPACLTMDFEITGTGMDAKFDEIVGEEIILQKPSLKTDGTGGISTSSELVNDGKDCKITVNLVFAWGDAFNNQNPYNYYNATVNPSADLIADAEAKLGLLSELNEEDNNAGYKFTLTTHEDA